MNLKIFNNIEDLKEIRRDWELLFLRNNCTVFQSFDFCYHSLPGSVIYIICLYNNDKIVEIWPCELINKRIRFINDAHADFCDILSITESLEVLEYLTDNKQINQLQLKNVKTDSLVFNKLQNFDLLSVLSSSYYSYLSLNQTDNFPSNFTHLVYRQKRRLKRILNKYDAQLSIVSVDNNSFPYLDIVNLRREMIKSNIRKNNFLDDNLLSVAEMMFKSGKLIISKLEYRDNIVAISLLFKDSSTYFFWIDLYSNLRMINLYHNISFMKNITTDSTAVFNFGRGVYKYKKQNFSPETRELYEINTFNSYFERFVFLINRLIMRIVVKWKKCLIGN